MTQQEHLDAIMAKCRASLALAEKRTPGRYVANINIYGTGVTLCCQTGQLPNGDTVAEIQERNAGLTREQAMGNAMYLAACAGAAEAGWRSTIAAIGAYRFMQGGATKFFLAQEIIAAWPEELL